LKIRQTRDHAETGVAKASFSPEDLMTGRFNFNVAILELFLPDALFTQHAN
jgi:hypothetical protein